MLIGTSWMKWLVCKLSVYKLLTRWVEVVYLYYYEINHKFITSTNGSYRRFQLLIQVVLLCRLALVKTVRRRSARWCYLKIKITFLKVWRQIKYFCLTRYFYAEALSQQLWRDILCSYLSPWISNFIIISIFVGILWVLVFCCNHLKSNVIWDRNLGFALQKTGIK